MPEDSFISEAIGSGERGERRDAVSVLPTGAGAAGTAVYADAGVLDADAELARAMAGDETLHAGLEAIGGHGIDDPRCAASGERVTAAGFRLARTPACTVRGLACKIRRLAEDLALGISPWTAELLAGIVADANRLSGFDDA
jgi:hypothetical protein